MRAYRRGLGVETRLSRSILKGSLRLQSRLVKVGQTFEIAKATRDILYSRAQIG